MQRFTLLRVLVVVLACEPRFAFPEIVLNLPILELTTNFLNPEAATSKAMSEASQGRVWLERDVVRIYIYIFKEVGPISFSLHIC